MVTEASHSLNQGAIGQRDKWQDSVSEKFLFGHNCRIRTADKTRNASPQGAFSDLHRPRNLPRPRSIQ